MTGDAFIDGLIVLVAVAIIAAVPFDLYVARELISGAVIRPRIPALTGMAVVSSSILAAALLAAIIAVNGVVFIVTSHEAAPVRILPPGLGTALLALCLLAFSTGNVYMLRLLRRWKREGVINLGQPAAPRRRGDPPDARFR